MESSGMTGAYIWMRIFLVASALFWGTALWVIVRGGRDAFDIIIKEKKSKINTRRVS